MILGIESSCDETGLAIFDPQQGLLANVLHSQIAVHKAFGGVVPELASRNHLLWLMSLLEKVLKKAKIKQTDLTAIAYTKGPGLIGALLTGACFAKGLAYSLNIPAIGIHHLEAHLLAAFLESKSHLSFPFLVLLVSGGHTLLLEAHALGHYTLLGETVDDAAGEAFDKTAKVLGLSYPGGPKLAELASHYPPAQPLPFKHFPRPMLNQKNFSFSGLKTHALLTWKKSTQDKTARCAIAYAFEEAVVDTLIHKCKRALLETTHRKLIVAGGVGANQKLRQKLKHVMDEIGGTVTFPPLSLCTDNGAMIAYAGYLYASHPDTSLGVEVKARWPLTSASI